MCLRTHTKYKCGHVNRSHYEPHCRCNKVIGTTMEFPEDCPSCKSNPDPEWDEAMFLPHAKVTLHPAEIVNNEETGKPEVKPMPELPTMTESRGGSSHASPSLQGSSLGSSSNVNFQPLDDFDEVGFLRHFRHPESPPAPSSPASPVKQPGLTSIPETPPATNQATKPKIENHGGRDFGNFASKSPEQDTSSNEEEHKLEMKFKSTFGGREFHSDTEDEVKGDEKQKWRDVQMREGPRKEQ